MKAIDYDFLSMTFLASSYLCILAKLEAALASAMLFRKPVRALKKFFITILLVRFFDCIRVRNVLYRMRFVGALM